MSRRIALATVGLVAALLLLAVIPLGLSLTANEGNSFRFGAQSAADYLSAQAEEYLADHDSPSAIDRALADAASGGDCATVYGRSSSIVAATPCVHASSPAAMTLVARIRAGRGDASARDGDWLLAAVSVGDDGNIAGVAVLARSADSMNDRIMVIWAWLAATGLGVLLLGIVFARWLGRWVNRPLDALGATAASFGDGAL